MPRWCPVTLASPPLAHTNRPRRGEEHSQKGGHLFPGLGMDVGRSQSNASASLQPKGFQTFLPFSLSLSLGHNCSNHVSSLFVQHLRWFQDSLLSSSANGKFVNPGTGCHTKSQKGLFVSLRMISNRIYLIVCVLCSAYIQFSPGLAHIIVLFKVNFPSRCSLRKSVLPQPRKSYLTVCSDLLIQAFYTLSP